MAQDHAIDLFEKDSRLGGHTHTHALDLDKQVNVDTGFIVMNNRNYPLLTDLFLELQVELHPTAMSFGVTSEDFSWGVDDYLSLRFLRNPQKIRLLFEIIRFNRLAKNIQSSDSIDSWLDQKKFSKFFKNYYILPMSAAIWSSSGETIKDFPMRSLSKFFDNHGLFNLLRRPQWYSVISGSKTYIPKLLQHANINNIFLNVDVRVTRTDQGVEIFVDNKTEIYDAVIFACHANQVANILDDISPTESETLSKFTYSNNAVVLHEDPALMPPNKKQWASWNGMRTQQKEFVTYWMNNLQKLDTEHEIFVSIGNFPQPQGTIHEELTYEHPIFNESTLAGQQQIKNIQGVNNTFYVGAHLGYGFHEDGIQSAFNIIKKLQGDIKL